MSELRKGARSDRGVVEWLAGVEDEQLYLSVLTIGELRKGIESVRRRDPPAAAALDTWIYRLESDYGDRLLPIDRTIAEEWGRLNVPDPLPVIDGLLAATAKVRGMTLVTRNVRDVERTGVLLVNPFTDDT